MLANAEKQLLDKLKGADARCCLTLRATAPQNRLHPREAPREITAIKTAKANLGFPRAPFIPVPSGQVEEYGQTLHIAEQKLAFRTKTIFCFFLQLAAADPKARNS